MDDERTTYGDPQRWAGRGQFLPVRWEEHTTFAEPSRQRQTLTGCVHSVQVRGEDRQDLPEENPSDATQITKYN
jgi:hypothetical protein